VPRHRVLVSAHRCGYAELGTVGGHEDPVAGIEHSARVGADYCEFDVRRCRDGTFVVSHDPDGGLGDPTVVISDLTYAELRSRAPDVCHLDRLLDALVATGMGAHVDMKFRTTASARAAGERWEVDLASILVERLDPGRIVFTAGVRATTTSLRAWGDAHAPSMVVALSIGGSVRGMPWRDAVQRRWSELFPQLRFRLSEADAVAAHFALAMVRLARWTTHIGVPLLVWTVDSPWLQRRFLHDRRIWMVTTNRPAAAVAFRDRGSRRGRWGRLGRG
jgi:glycerophosphoryl diester phosphodiesterase